MRVKIFLLFSGLFLFLGLACLITKWQGTASASLALPLSGSSVQLSGAASGGWAVLGLLGLVLGLLMLLLALLTALLSGISRKAAPPAPSIPE